MIQHPERINDAGLDLIVQMLKYTPNVRPPPRPSLAAPTRPLSRPCQHARRRRRRSI